MDKSDKRPKAKYIHINNVKYPNPYWNCSSSLSPKQQTSLCPPESNLP